jgi:D-aspartate ligase
MHATKDAAVIIGGDFQGLGIARNLKELGIRIIVVDPVFCISMFSNFIDKYYKCPPLDNVDDFKNFLIELAAKAGVKGAVLYPTSDIAVRILSKFRDELTRYYLVPTPPWKTIDLAFDKKNVYSLAQEISISVPATFYPENEEDLSSISLDFPAILKPAITANLIPHTSMKAIKVNNREELVSKYRYMTSLIDKSEIMVQELIGGGTKNLYSFCCLFSDGEIKAKLMANRLRQHPMDFGTATTYAVTCNIPELEELSRRFLRKINYYGLCEVEFMYDEKSCTFKLIDVNTRTWAWHTLGAKAGVNFSSLLFRDIHNEQPFVESFETGVKWIREITDPAVVLVEIVKGSLTVKDYLRSMTGKKELAVFSCRDPLPLFAELLTAPYRFYKKAKLGGHHSQ